MHLYFTPTIHFTLGCALCFLVFHPLMYFTMESALYFLGILPINIWLRWFVLCDSFVFHSRNTFCARFCFVIPLYSTPDNIFAGSSFDVPWYFTLKPISLDSAVYFLGKLSVKIYSGLGFALYFICILPLEIMFAGSCFVFPLYFYIFTGLHVLTYIFTGLCFAFPLYCIPKDVFPLDVAFHYLCIVPLKIHFAGFFEIQDFRKFGAHTFRGCRVARGGGRSWTWEPWETWETWGTSQTCQGLQLSGLTRVYTMSPQGQGGATYLQ